MLQADISDACTQFFEDSDNKDAGNVDEDIVIEGRKSELDLERA